MMFALRTRRSAARLLLGALVAAFAMLSLHVGAKPAAEGGGAHAGRAGMAMAVPAEASDHEHCNPAPADPLLLLCKHHCQSEIQTLDHPRADLPQVSLGVICVMAHAQLRVPVATIAIVLGPVLLHPGGAPPPYAATARLRI